MTKREDDSDNSEEWPPKFNLELTDRKKAIMNCIELMERLTEEYGGTGKVVRTSDNKLAIQLEYNLPEKEK